MSGQIIMSDNRKTLCQQLEQSEKDRFFIEDDNAAASHGMRLRLHVWNYPPLPVNLEKNIEKVFIIK